MATAAQTSAPLELRCKEILAPDRRVKSAEVIGLTRDRGFLVADLRLGEREAAAVVIDRNAGRTVSSIEHNYFEPLHGRRRDVIVKGDEVIVQEALSDASFGQGELLLRSYDPFRQHLPRCGTVNWEHTFIYDNNTFGLADIAASGGKVYVADTESIAVIAGDGTLGSKKHGLPDIDAAIEPKTGAFMIQSRRRGVQMHNVNDPDSYDYYMMKLDESVRRLELRSSTKSLNDSSSPRTTFISGGFLFVYEYPSGQYGAHPAATDFHAFRIGPSGLEYTNTMHDRPAGFDRHTIWEVSGDALVTDERSSSCIDVRDLHGKHRPKAIHDYHTGYDGPTGLGFVGQARRHNGHLVTLQDRYLVVHPGFFDNDLFSQGCKVDPAVYKLPGNVASFATTRHNGLYFTTSEGAVLEAKGASKILGNNH